jgi:ubiquinone/menaquinone biosynthesis C-methylase UbiE
MAGYIHGETNAREVARLEKQARFCAPMTLDGLAAAPGMRVLDLATGVGAMAGEIVSRWPGARLSGVDLSIDQLRTARANHPTVCYAQADGTRLPFRDGTFERVHCSWLLEHVPRPVEVLREVRRVLTATGSAHFVEVDNSSLRTTPPCPDVDQVMAALCAAQQRAGGDPYIGRRLGALFTEAGFTKVAVRPAELHGTARDPANFLAIVEEFAEIFESVTEALGPEQASQLQRAAAEVRALLHRPGADLYYCGFAAVAAP